MTDFRPYRRTAIAELAPWTPETDMEGVSVSEADLEAGSPKPGDMIARNPKNHVDQWLVAAQYFRAHFEPLAPQPDAEPVEALECLAYEERAVPRFRKALLRLSADERLDDSEQEALAAAHSVLVALTRARKIMESTDD